MDRNDTVQWALMNSPEKQAEIRRHLMAYLRSFLDTAPEGNTQERFIEVLRMLKWYFEKELEGSATDWTELILATLSASIRRIPSDEKMRDILGTPQQPMDPEEWKKFEQFLDREGLRGWWD